MRLCLNFTYGIGIVSQALPDKIIVRVWQIAVRLTPRARQEMLRKGLQASIRGRMATGLGEWETEMDKRNFILLGAAAMLAACGGASDGGNDVASGPDMQAYMAEVVQPTAEVYWGSAGWIIDEAGEHDLTPTTEERWAATLQSTKDLQAIGELLMTEEYSVGRGEDWNTFAQGLVDVAKRAEQTAVDRDSDAIFETGAIVYNVCQGCHLAYVPEEMEAAAAATEAEAGQ